jgi:hypothetical protein
MADKAELTITCRFRQQQRIFWVWPRVIGIGFLRGRVSFGRYDLPLRCLAIVTLWHDIQLVW